jgi:hypothetical protein
MVGRYSENSQLLPVKRLSIAGVLPHRKKRSFGNVGPSRVLNLLGKDWLARFPAVKVPGTVVWCNFELARELGFDVPSSNRMTPAFHQRLIDALSYQAVQPGDRVDSRQTIVMYADRYGGDGIGKNLGAGRAGFLPYGNLYLKGVGLTPLFRLHDPDDWEHIHGGHRFDEALKEALFGEVNVNLFTRGSARVLALIDQGKYIKHGRQKTPSVLVARSGVQLRPAHLLAKPAKCRKAWLDLFVRVTGETGQLVTRKDPATGQPVPDIKATMLRIIDDHARTAAEQIRWRMVHCALSPSNMELSGAMLDLAIQTSQPRTAPVCVLDYPDSVYGREHIERAIQLGPVYRALIRSLSKRQRQRFNAQSLDLRNKMDKAYQNHLQVVLLRAVGLKTAVAERLRADWPDLARRFAELLLKMIELKNPGILSAFRSVCDSVSVLDVFNLLRYFPHTYFAAPEANHAKTIRALLKPIFRGNQRHRARKRAGVNGFIREFDQMYHELMTTCESLAEEYYGDAANLRASVIARAAVENEPFSLLYYRKLQAELVQTIAVYKSTGDADGLQKAIDRRIAASLRNVDALVVQGRSRRMTDGGVELQLRTIDGVNYSLRAWDDARQRRQLRVSFRLERDGDDYRTPLPDYPRLTRRQLRLLRYRFTTNGGADVGDVGVRLEQDERGCAVVSCKDIRPLPRVGRLEGRFYVKGHGSRRVNGDLSGGIAYPFAVPDTQELRKLMAERNWHQTRKVHKPRR